MNATATDWIKPGAAVVVYRHRPGQDDNPQRSTVEKVAAKSFTVAGISKRIQLGSLESKNIGSSYTGWCYRVVAPSDPKVAELDAAARRSRLASEAIHAVEEWNMGARRSNRDRVQAAIDALTALRDAL